MGSEEPLTWMSPAMSEMPPRISLRKPPEMASDSIITKNDTDMATVARRPLNRSLPAMNGTAFTGISFYNVRSSG